MPDPGLQQEAEQAWNIWSAGFEFRDRDVDPTLRGFIAGHTAAAESRDQRIRALGVELLIVTSERDRLAGFKEGVVEHLRYKTEERQSG